MLSDNMLSDSVHGWKIMLSDNMLSENMLSDNMLTYNIMLSDNMLSDNIVLSDNMLSYFFWKLHTLVIHIDKGEKYLNFLTFLKIIK
jgi:nitrous oxidase accessory protein NosD